MPKSIKERTQQLQNTVVQLVDSLNRGNLEPGELQQKHDELQTLLTKLSQQINEGYQESESNMDALFGGQSSTVHITEIEQRLVNTENELKHTNEKCQALLDKQSELIERYSKISEKQINALKENGFFSKASVPPEIPYTAQTPPNQPAVPH
ncbi:hypothetical protein [Legionella rowbothamii]|uniref:hypothetical protein n=1 Tax=Legionella rowbothamii TaxID=96229 RepID=UPI001056C0D9|nr:hypothetical protein [Legionella rowbothamii]